VPHQSRGASSVLFYHYIDQLVRAGHDVFCLLLLEKDEDSSQLPCEALGAVVGPLLLRFGRYSGRTIPAALPANATRRASEFRADIVVYFDIGSRALCRALGEGRRTLVWLGDLAHQSLWHHALYDAREDWRAALRLPKTWLVCRRWRAAYGEFLRGVDRVIVSSHSSEVALPGARYLPYPWPVEKPFRSVAAARRGGDKPRFLFCGTLSGLGSRSAIHYLLDTLYPVLLRRWGARGFEVLITGTRSLADWAMASIRTKPEIVFEGFVDDLYARMDRCHAAIVPIDVPVGNRSRILTAMGYGLLVIAHPSTALGNPALVSGETCLLAASAADFAQAMARAYEDAAGAARIEHAARKVYERQFAPQAAGAMLEAELRALS